MGAAATAVTAASLLQAGPSVAAAAPDDEFVPIAAVLQRYLKTPGDVVLIGGRRVHAGGYLLQVREAPSILALTLDPRRPSASSQFKMVPATTPSIGAVASALWLRENASSVGQPLSDQGLETAAVQAAIWVEQGTLRVSPRRIPGSALRKRVGELVNAAPDTVSDDLVPQYPTGLQFTSTIRKIDSEWVTLQLVALQSGETTFNQPQDIDLRVDGTWFVVKSGQQTDIELDADPDTEIDERSSRSGQAPDNNTALVRIPRTDEVLPLDARWNLSYDMATVLLGDANQPAMLTLSPIDLRLPQQLELNPSDYPNSQAPLLRQAESLWRGLGPAKWPVLLFALWALPNIALLLNKLVAAVWASGRRRVRKMLKRRKKQRAREQKARKQSAREEGAQEQGKEQKENQGAP